MLELHIALCEKRRPGSPRRTKNRSSMNLHEYHPPAKGGPVIRPLTPRCFPSLRSAADTNSPIPSVTTLPKVFIDFRAQ